MDFLDCKICQAPYDEEEHRPRHAPCGHEFCSECIKALILESSFMCPNCRQKYKVDVLDDLPINFGLIDVIRAFKTNKISLSNETKPNSPGDTNNEVCKLHHKEIRHGCITCEIWICEDCHKSHSPLIGCSVLSLNEAMGSMQKKHSETVDKQLTIFEKDVSRVGDNIRGHTAEKNKLLEKIENHDDEIRKLQNVLDEGNTLKEDLENSKKDLNAADSPSKLTDKIEVLKHKEQSLRIWSMKNLEEIPEPNSRQDLLEELTKGLKIFVEMIFKNEKMHSKLSLCEGNILFPSLKTQQVTRDGTYISFEKLQKMIPKDPSLVFFEMSLGGVAEGIVLVRLDKSLPNIRKHMVTIVTGQLMKSLAGTQLTRNRNLFIEANNLQLTEVTVIPDTNGGSRNKSCDVVACYEKEYIKYLFFNVGSMDWTNSTAHKVVGSIVTGMDIVQKCYNNHTLGILITKCGLVIE